MTNLSSFCHVPLNCDVIQDDSLFSIPWWLAIVIAIPLIVITIAIVKILMIVKEKNRIRKEQREATYNRLTPNVNGSSVG